MYTPGKIIYFDPFHFKDTRKETKPKYFLVLKVINGRVILATLPSSQNHLPADIAVSHGCIDMADRSFNCYVFEANQSITSSGWSFPLRTYLYGFWLEDYNIHDLLKQYSIAGVDYEEIGELTLDELSAVINCFRNSSVVKRKYKRMLD